MMSGALETVLDPRNSARVVGRLVNFLGLLYQP